jgi:hypothetical protein
MASTNKENPQCPNCNKSGLAILPVRYAVVPDDVDATLPSPLGNKVTDVKLKHHKYALRTLRQGFVYLYYEKHARGSHIKWEAYSVSAAGTLWKQVSISAMESVQDERCSRKGHNLPASVIAIESPEKCGRVWMAFSEHAWSVDTFKSFEQDMALRDRRMQTFAPAIWIKERGYRHGIEVSEKTLNDIIEYKSGFALTTLAGNNIAEISKPDGSYNMDRLKRRATQYPLTIRRDDKEKLVDLMKSVGEVPNGPGNAPIIIAFWDSVGITHELNGYRNDAAGWIQKYGNERELEIGALSAIEGVKKALEDREGKKARSAADFGVFKWDAESTRKRLENYDTMYPGNVPGHARQADLCKRWERDAAARIPSSIANRRGFSTSLSEPDWQASMAEIDKAAAHATMPNRATGQSLVQARDERGKKWANQAANEAVAEAWSKYEPRIDRDALDAFKKAYTSLVSAASALADERTEDVVAWMKSPFLQDALTEFHPSNLFDGVSFESVVGSMFFGISSSPAGLALIKEWVHEAKANDSNLLWRLVALNHEEGISAVNGALTAAVSGKDVPFTESALEAARDSTKYFAKLGDLVKKGLSLHNTLRKDGVYRVPTGGTEKFFMTVGHLFFQPFIKKGADLLSEKFVLGLLLARSGSEYSKIMSLFAAEAKFGKIGRTETLVMLSMGHAVGSKGFTALKEAWAALTKDADTPKTNDAKPRLAGGFNEAKELRFAMVATLLQLVHLSKLYLDAENDPNNKHLQGELWAAGLSLSAGLADLGATAIKGLHTLKDAAPSFQALKLAGGVLSAGSAWVLFQQDRAKAEKSQAAGHEDLAYLYVTRAYVNLAGGACSVLTALSYTKPAFEMIAAKFPSTMLGRASAIIPRVASRVAARLLIGRAVLMLGGIWFSVATVAIQLLIWKFSDDELQEWCGRCAFGVNSNNRIKNAKIQMTQFENALKEVM